MRQIIKFVSLSYENLIFNSFINVFTNASTSSSFSPFNISNSSSKIEANVEWELLGGAWNEREGEAPWAEFDTTDASGESVVAAIQAWVADGFKPADPEAVLDWIARMDE